MTRMTGPDCVVMCNLINTYIHTLAVCVLLHNAYKHAELVQEVKIEQVVRYCMIAFVYVDHVFYVYHYGVNGLQAGALTTNMSPLEKMPRDSFMLRISRGIL